MTLPSGISLPIGNQYAQNVALKLQLNKRWSTANAKRRFALAKFYVSTWGGVKRNKDATLKGYVAQRPSSLMRAGVKGIASWSKVLCIRDPYKYAIYDARVSAALNCVQIVERVKRGTLFPLLPGQNQTIQDAIPRIRAYARANHWIDVDKSECYETYIALLAEVANRCKAKNTKIYTIEMLLFSSAKDLVAKAFL
jgi:hypothetical protein